MKVNFRKIFLLLSLCYVLIGCGSGEEAVLNNIEISEDGMDEKAPKDIKMQEDDKPLKLAIDDSIAWTSIKNANGDLQTVTDSRLGELGINMEIQLDNTVESKVEKFINGEIDAFGCSVARFAELYPKLENANKSAVMVCVISKSKGAHEILSQQSIKSFDELLVDGGQVASYPDSCASDLLIWHVNNDDALTLEEKMKLKNSIKIYNSPEEAEETFLSGQASALCAGELELSIDFLKQNNEANVLLSSEANDTVLIYGIVFDGQYIDNHKSMVVNFVAALMNEVDENINDYQKMGNYVFVGRKENYDLYGVIKNDKGEVEAKRSILKDLYFDMSTTSEKNTNYAIETAIMLETGTSGWEFMTEYEDGEITILTWEEWETKSGVNIAENFFEIYFKGESAEFEGDPTDTIEKINTLATIRGGTDIILVGHVANLGQKDTQNGRKISTNRAMAVAEMLADEYGVKKKRITVVGVGVNQSAEVYKESDRRVEVIFRESE